MKVDARATDAQLAPGHELDEAMFKGLQMMEDFEARAQGATTVEEDGGTAIALEVIMELTLPSFICTFSSSFVVL